ncbi:alpha/beta-Hydrolases superfamily protein [Striga asiatica]|uniref:Alpha/beta-Hydrolases superfamily protein n=1 Tax=Striga asiatica TaxID=4170 RepID=A0A5A7R252_STRAF|nr:alpha/beta-Hydrolases superfamily protein [Striga asiatica]
MLAASVLVAPPILLHTGKYTAVRSNGRHNFRVSAAEFPAFLPKEVESVKDLFARKLASRIERLPVHLTLSKTCLMSSCVKPKTQLDASPLVLLHGFDSSCLEWRCTLPLLEEHGLETWAIDVLGWGFSDLGNVDSKRDHLYQFWSSYIKRPMVLIGPSLGAAIAIDFAVNYPEAVYLLRSLPLRIYATSLAFNGSLPWETCLDWTNIGRLHCSLPWWADATVDFMISGGYSVSTQIEQVKQKTLIIWGENDQIIDYKLAVRLHSELPNAILRQIQDCGHIPHVEKPEAVSKLIAEFVKAEDKVNKLRKLQMLNFSND